MSPTPLTERLRLERDLYVACLALAHAEDPTPLLDDALALLRELAVAERGYVEIEDAWSSGPLHWSSAAGVDESQRAEIKDRISRGVIAAAIESGQTVHTPSALLDARFEARESVQSAEIEAVLCVPVVARGLTGVVYLQNHIGGGPFADADVECVETVARYVGSLAGRLLELLRRRRSEDQTADVRSRIRVNGVVGHSAALAKVLERIEVVAPMESNVLLTGPNGTGKSMFARILHDNSARASAAFVALNCAALPEGLVENELFGAVRGAHAGAAAHAVKGKVAAASGGTLFLDEVGELPASVQAKLLTLVQSKEYFPLGGATAQLANVRIVAATNRDLESAVAEGNFRPDLYYRLRSVRIDLPALASTSDRKSVPGFSRSG